MIVKSAQRLSARKSRSKVFLFGLLLIPITVVSWMLNPLAPTVAHAAQTGGALELVSGTNHANTTSTSLQPFFEILNASTTSVSLSSLSIRYWYTIDTTATQVFTCVSARFGCGNVTGSFAALTPATGTANSYLQVSFSAGAGTLAPGHTSGLLQARIQKSDNSLYNQTNDYSWNGGQSARLSDTVGLYENGQLLWGTEPGVAASVTINPQSSLGRLPSTAIGVNDAVWDSNLTDSTLPGLLSAAGTKVMRYPGGSTADVYHWQSNSTEPNQSFANPNNTFDVFMGQVKATGAQAMITVNYGSGTPQEAANWVQYANKGAPNYTGPVPTYPGASTTGQNYGVKYWEIGNEIYGNTTYGGDWEFDVHAPGPAAYANNVVAYSQAMKAVDPTVKIGLVLTAPGNWPDGQTSATSPQPWDDTVLPIACPATDFVIVHWYPQGPTGETDAGLLNAPETGESTSVSFTPSIPSMIASVRAEINKYCGSRASAIQIMVTEANSVSFNTGKQTVGLVNGLFLDDDYMTWLENGVANVDWWDVHNSATGGNNNSSSLYGTAQYGDYGLLSNGTCASASICEAAAETPFPDYYALQMLTHLVQTGDTMLSSTSSNSLLSVHTVKQAHGRLAVMLINKDPSVTYDVTLSLGSVCTATTATVYRYGQNSTAITASTQLTGRSTITVSVAPYSTNTVVVG